jgi:DNA invertase Pin-like site-specific DNA recombinase
MLLWGLEAMVCKLIAYRRVSTKKQGASGLGLDAQDAAIRAYAESTGCKVLGTYTEVETGKKDNLKNRPQLVKAIAHANRSQATLVIAKLDRLTRSVAVTSELHTSGVQFVACDNPHANRMTIQILAVMAEHEAKETSNRTKSALAAFKAGKKVPKRLRELYPNGVPQDLVDATAGKLGGTLPNCRNLTDEARKRGVENAAISHREKADKAYADLIPDLRQWKAEGLTYQKIADRLNEEGHTTRRQRPWNWVQVKRVLDRAKRVSQAFVW